MSTNEANIKITVDDSDLLTTDRRLERVEEGLEGVGREARQAGTSIRGVGQAAAGAVAGLMSMELAKQALSAAINGLRASITAFAESNEEGQRTVDAVTASLDQMKAAFGEAMIGGENAELVVASLSETFDTLRQYIDDNSEAIAALTVSGLELFGDGVEATIVFVEDLASVLTALNDVMGDTENDLVRVESRLSGVMDTLARLNFGPVRFTRLSLESLGSAWEYVTGAAEAHNNQLTRGTVNFRHLSDDANEATRSILTMGLAMMTTATTDVDGMEAGYLRAIAIIEQFQNVGDGDSRGRGTGGADDNKMLSEVLAEQAVMRKAAGFALLQEKNEIAAMILDQQKLEQQAKLDSQAEFLRMTAEQEREFAAARLARAEEQQRVLEELRKKQTAIATSGARSLQSALLAVSAGTAKQRKAALKKMLGQELVQRGGALIAQGIGNAIALNPKGALEIAGGASMVAAGAKLSGGGGGKGGSPTANATPPSSTTNTTNVTYNQSTQFGFVGDRRAATREIEEINRRSADRGL